MRVWSRAGQLLLCKFFISGFDCEIFAVMSWWLTIFADGWLDGVKGTKAFISLGLVLAVHIPSGAKKRPELCVI